jgi:hypothetical protein
MHYNTCCNLLEKAKSKDIQTSAHIRSKRQYRIAFDAKIDMLRKQRNNQKFNIVNLYIKKREPYWNYDIYIKNDIFLNIIFGEGPLEYNDGHGHFVFNLKTKCIAYDRPPDKPHVIQNVTKPPLVVTTN